MLCCNTGPKPKVKEDDFEDLLETQGFGSRPDRKGPRTIAEMRRQEITKEIDPLKLQVANEYVTWSGSLLDHTYSSLKVLLSVYYFKRG